jgi:hypothetical protein
MFAATLVLAPAALAEDDKTVTVPETMGTSISHQSLTHSVLIERLDEAAEELQEAVYAHSGRSQTTRDDEIRVRMQRFDEAIGDMKKRSAGYSTVSTDHYKDVDDLVNAYFEAVRAVSWLPQSETVARELPPVQREMDRLVAMYGGYTRFDVPDFVKINQYEDVDDDEVDFKVRTEGTTTTVTNPEKDDEP